MAASGTHAGVHRTLGRVTTHRRTFTGRALRHGFGGQGVRCSRKAVVHLVGHLNFGVIASFCRTVTSRRLSIGRVVSGCRRRREQRGSAHSSVICHDTRNCGLRRNVPRRVNAGRSMLIVSRGLGKLSFGLTHYYGPVCKSSMFNFIDIAKNVGVRHYSYPGTDSLRSHFNCHVIGTH